jgi:CRISPR-associated endoribonuclease Cas6
MEVVSAVEFNDVMAYRCLTPLSLLAQSRDHGGGAKYLSPSDEDFHKLFKENLLRRLLRFQPEFQSLKELDRYCPEIQFELLNRPEKKGITLKRNAEEPLNIVGLSI